MVAKKNEPTAYTRNEALAAGVLQDITEFGKSVGLSWPVAISRAAWDECMAGVDGHLVVMRIQDVLEGVSYHLMLSTLAGQESPAAFELEINEPDDFYRDPDTKVRPRPATLAAMLEEDENGNRCLTIVVVGEDWRKGEVLRRARRRARPRQASKD